MAGNTLAAGRMAGGLDSVAGGTTTVTNSIVAGNSANNCAGAPTSSGHNLAGDCSCTFKQPGDIVAADPGLRALASNGGFTQTRALVSGSPAIDAASDPACPKTDQRGVARPQLAHCDIGAYEYSPPVASAPTTCSTWGMVPITVTPGQGGAPPTAAHFRIDGGAEQVAGTTGNPGSATVSLPPGTHALEYWGESLGGDQELSHHTATIVVDPNAPAVSITSDQGTTSCAGTPPPARQRTCIRSASSDPRTPATCSCWNRGRRPAARTSCRSRSGSSQRPRAGKVWSVERRENVLEVQSVLNLAKRAG